MEEARKRLLPPEPGQYMGFIDDDVLISASAINRLLAVARIHNLSAAQPAVSFGSSLVRNMAATAIACKPAPGADCGNAGLFIRRIC